MYLSANTLESFSQKQQTVFAELSVFLLKKAFKYSMRCLKGNMIIRVWGFFLAIKQLCCLCPASYFMLCCYPLDFVSKGTCSCKKRAFSCVIAGILYAEDDKMQLTLVIELLPYQWSFQVRIRLCYLLESEVEIHNSIILFCAWVLCK